MEKPQVSRLRIYPIKSLGPVELQEAEIGIRSLKNDRLLAMIDEQGRYINGKRTRRVNQLKAVYDLSNGLVALTDRNTGVSHSFELREGNHELDEYLSDFFEIQLRLVKSTKGELMDMPGASSVTLVSEASLKSLQKDLNTHTLEQMRLRFRTNIEIVGVEAFGEEKLFRTPGMGMRFNVGEVNMIGVSPRARCSVPPQHPLTGEVDKSFVRKMIKSRNDSLPANSTLLQYGRSTYYLTVNVYLPETEAGKKIKLGDTLEIGEPVELGDFG